MRVLIAIAAGGAAGAVSRYLVSVGLERWLGKGFGYGTLLVNVVGCFAIGWLMHGGATRSPWMQHPGLIAGLLGGLTTFSTFGYQTVGHLERGEGGLALANIAANVVLGCLAATAGIGVSRWMTAG